MYTGLMIIVIGGGIMVDQTFKVHHQTHGMIERNISKKLTGSKCLVQVVNNNVHVLVKRV